MATRRTMRMVRYVPTIRDANKATWVVVHLIHAVNSPLITKLLEKRCAGVGATDSVYTALTRDIAEALVEARAAGEVELRNHVHRFCLDWSANRERMGASGAVRIAMSNF